MCSQLLRGCILFSEGAFWVGFNFQKDSHEEKTKGAWKNAENWIFPRWKTLKKKRKKKKSFSPDLLSNEYVSWHAHSPSEVFSPWKNSGFGLRIIFSKKS